MRDEVCDGIPSEVESRDEQNDERKDPTLASIFKERNEEADACSENRKWYGQEKPYKEVERQKCRRNI